MITDTPSAAASPSSSTPTRESLGGRAWLIILATAIVVCCFNLGGARSLTEHEIFVAAGAKQMASDHDWLLPKIGDHFWLEKPPLLHWCVVLSGAICGGFSEAAVRLPSVIAGLGIVVLMTLLSLRWFGEKIAIFTALIQTTTVYFMTYARLAEAEMLLAFLVVLALFVFVRLQGIGSDPPQSSALLAFSFWVLVGLSNNAKGLGFGPVLILAPCLAFLILKRDRLAWRRMISWSGFAIGVAIALAWPITIASRHPGAGELWYAELVKRAFGETQYNQPWWYYLTTVPWQLLPWTLVLLLAVRPSLERARRDSNSPDRFLWCWGMVPIALLSLTQSKHHHYIISCLCAFVPLCAFGLLRLGTRVAATCVLLVLAGTLFVHGRILSYYDRSRDDRDFLKSVRAFVPPNASLLATGGQEIARHIFYVDPPPHGIWDPDNLKYFCGAPFYLISRRQEQNRLTKLGRIEVISESRRTRKERTPDDRFTLFRVEPIAVSTPASP